jgi:hypothetical protein
MKKFIPTEEELKNILKMYNEDLLGSHTIAEKTGISKPTILRILKENGVIMGPSGRRFTGGKKIADKKTASSAKTNVQAGGSSKFIAKASTKSSGASKKPIKTGGSRGS